MRSLGSEVDLLIIKLINTIRDHTDIHFKILNAKLFGTIQHLLIKRIHHGLIQEVFGRI